jgi:TfoX/Sxy family transcriptional regulator of competence genes
VLNLPLKILFIMAYSQLLADRIRQILKEKQVLHVVEKRMMAGITFMVNDKMCIGVINDELMARIHPDWMEEALTLNGCRQMIHQGRAMKGYVFISPEGIDLEDDLDFWVQRALDFNPLAKSSKQKKGT